MIHSKRCPEKIWIYIIIVQMGTPPADPPGQSDADARLHFFAYKTHKQLSFLNQIISYGDKWIHYEDAEPKKYWSSEPSASTALLKRNLFADEIHVLMGYVWNWSILIIYWSHSTCRDGVHWKQVDQTRTSNYHEWDISYDFQTDICMQHAKKMNTITWSIV